MKLEQASLGKTGEGEMGRVGEEREAKVRGNIRTRSEGTRREEQKKGKAVGGKARFCLIWWKAVD